MRVLTDKFFVYDDFLTNKDADDVAERIVRVPSYEHLSYLGEQKLSLKESVEKVIKEIITDGIKNIPLESVKFHPSYPLGRAEDITVEICSLENSNMPNLQLYDQSSSVLAHYVYYPMQKWEPDWHGEIFIEKGTSEGLGEFIMPRANRLVLIQHETSFSLSRIDNQAPLPLTLIKGVVLGKSF